LNAEFWWGNLRDRDHLEDLRVDGRIILNLWSRSEIGAWTALMWLRIRRDGGLLQMLE
jgi:hypothetical protein